MQGLQAQRCLHHQSHSRLQLAGPLPCSKQPGVARRLSGAPLYQSKTLQTPSALQLGQLLSRGRESAHACTSLQQPCLLTLDGCAAEPCHSVHRRCRTANALSGAFGDTSQQPYPDNAGAASPTTSAAAATASSQQQQTQKQQQQPAGQPPEATSSNSSSSSSISSIIRQPRFQLWSLGAPLAWGFMFAYIGIMLVLPIAALLTKASSIPMDVFIARATEPVALSAYFVSFSVAIAAALINAVFGFILAWVLVKFKFPGKKWIDAAVDLPFALPTSVAGLTLATVYSDEGVLGQALMAAGVDVVFTRLGVAVAMVFVSFPFVVRTMQPVLQEMEKEVEEAAWSLGASPWTTFTQVLLPPLLPPLLTGTALAFSRALGEFGSVVIVSSNFPFKDLIAPVLIFQYLEQYDFVGATVIGTVLLMISLVMMVGVNWLQSYAQRFRRQ